LTDDAAYHPAPAGHVLVQKSGNPPLRRDLSRTALTWANRPKVRIHRRSSLASWRTQVCQTCTASFPAAQARVADEGPAGLPRRRPVRPGPRHAHPASQPVVSKNAPISSRESGADLRLRREARPLSCSPRWVRTCSSYCGPASPSTQSMSSCALAAKVTCQDSGSRVVALRCTRSPDSKAIEATVDLDSGQQLYDRLLPSVNRETQRPRLLPAARACPRDRPKKPGPHLVFWHHPPSCGVPLCGPRRPGTSKDSWRTSRSSFAIEVECGQAAWQGSCRLRPLPGPPGSRTTEQDLNVLISLRTRHCCLPCSSPVPTRVVRNTALGVDPLFVDT